MDGKDALRTIAAFRLAMPRTILRFAGGREITLGDLGTRDGLLGGINAVIVGNYLTTLGRPADRGPRAARRAEHADQGPVPDAVSDPDVVIRVAQPRGPRAGWRVDLRGLRGFQRARHRSRLRELFCATPHRTPRSPKSSSQSRPDDELLGTVTPDLARLPEDRRRRRTARRVPDAWRRSETRRVAASARHWSKPASPVPANEDRIRSSSRDRWQRHRGAHVRSDGIRTIARAGLGPVPGTDLLAWRLAL